MDVLGKACKDKEESCGDGKLNFAEISDILTIANQVAEHSRQGNYFNMDSRKDGLQLQLPSCIIACVCVRACMCVCKCLLIMSLYMSTISLLM